MKRKEFKLLLEQYDQFQQNCVSMLECGVDLFEHTKYPTAEYTDIFFEKLIKQNYNEFGVDWITWFVYENDFGRNNLKATDNEKSICQTVDELYDYCEQYKKKK